MLGEPEVRKLEAQILCQEEVLELEVSVDHDVAALVHVLEDVDHLVEEEPANVLAHGPVLLAESEHGAAWNVLEDEVHEVVYSAAGGLDDLPLDASFDLVDNAFVCK